MAISEGCIPTVDIAEIAEPLPEIGDPALAAAILFITARVHAVVIALFAVSRFRGAYFRGEEA